MYNQEKTKILQEKDNCTFQLNITSNETEILKQKIIDIEKINKNLEESNINYVEIITLIEAKRVELIQQHERYETEVNALKKTLHIIVGIIFGIFLVIIVFIIYTKVKSNTKCKLTASTTNEIVRLKQKNQNLKLKNQQTMQKTINDVKQERKKSTEADSLDVRPKIQELPIPVPTRTTSMMIMSSDLINKPLPKLPGEEYLIYATSDLLNPSNSKQKNPNIRKMSEPCNSKTVTNANIYGRIFESHEREKIAVPLVNLLPPKIVKTDDSVNSNIIIQPHSTLPSHELIYATLDIPKPKNNAWLQENQTIYAAISYGKVGD